MELTRDLETITSQERELILAHFDPEIAWQLGRRLRDLAVSRHYAVAIEVRRFGQQLFYNALAGAARAIAVETALAGAASITIVNRDPVRGSELVTLLNEKTQAKARLVDWDRGYRVPEASDIVVNATSIGLFPDVEARLNLDLDSLHPGLVLK